MVNDSSPVSISELASDYSFFFRIPQLFVRISVQLSSPGVKPNPQICRVAEGGENDGSRFLL